MSKQAPSEQCCKDVYEARRFGGAPCTRRAQKHTDGKSYCWQHNPDRVAEERRKREEKWVVERKQDAERWAKKEAIEKAKQDDFDLCEKARRAGLNPHKILGDLLGE